MPAKQTSNDQSLELFRQILLTGEAIGPKALLNTVKSARNNASIQGDNSQKLTIHFIINLLVKVFKVSKKELKHGRSHGARTQAIQVGAVVCKKILKLNCEEIGLIFEVDKSNLARYISKFNRFRVENKEEALLIQHCQKITDATNKYYNSIKVN